MEIVNVLTFQSMASPFVMALVHSFLAGFALVAMFAFVYYAFGALFRKNRWKHALLPLASVLVLYFGIQYYENLFIQCNESYQVRSDKGIESYKNCLLPDGRVFRYDNKFPVLSYVEMLDK